MMAEWQELKGVGPSQGKGEMSASSLEDMQNNRGFVVIEFCEKQSRNNALTLYRDAYPERSRKPLIKQSSMLKHFIARLRVQ